MSKRAEKQLRDMWTLAFTKGSDTVLSKLKATRPEPDEVDVLLSALGEIAQNAINNGSCDTGKFIEAMNWHLKMMRLLERRKEAL